MSKIQEFCSDLPFSLSDSEDEETNVSRDKSPSLDEDRTPARGRRAKNKVIMSPIGSSTKHLAQLPFTLTESEDENENENEDENADFAEKVEEDVNGSRRYNASSAYEGKCAESQMDQAGEYRSLFTIMLTKGTKLKISQMDSLNPRQKKRRRRGGR